MTIAAGTKPGRYKIPLPIGVGARVRVILRNT